jgi:DNA-binding IclR family transcriptional regulator
VPIKPAPAVLRAMQVLEFLYGDHAAAPTMSEIARRTGLSKATCHSVLLALAEGGYVRRDPTSLVYSLGPGLISLGSAASSSLLLPAIARSEMESLSESLGVTSVAAVSAGSHLVAISTVSPPQSFQVSLPVGQMVPYAPPLGAAFIAWASKREIDAWLDRAPRSLTEEERLHYGEALALVRDQGYSVTLAEPLGRHLGGEPDEPPVEAALLPPSEPIGDFGGVYLPTSLVEGRTYRLTQLSAPVFDRAGIVSLVILGVAVGLELTTPQIAAYGRRVRQAASRLELAIGRLPGESEDPLEVASG